MKLAVAVIGGFAAGLVVGFAVGWELGLGPEQ